MRFLTVRFVILFIGISALEASAQTPNYIALFRHSSAQVETGARGEKSCLLISPSGEFRLERGFALNLENKKPKVFTGSLSAEQMNSLQELLSAPEFINLDSKKAGTPNRTFTRDADIFAAQIPRGEKTQSVYFIQDDYHSKWPPGLKELEKWFLKAARQKLVEDKSKLPNNCSTL